jgi:hypothetical protein
VVGGQLALTERRRATLDCEPGHEPDAQQDKEDDAQRKLGGQTPDSHDPVTPHR